MAKKITLTASQQAAFIKLVNFINNETERVFILKGYAGTGKTTLMRFLLEDLQKHNKQYQLLASTGRAAKILSDVSGDDNASTIHGLIYKYKDLNKDLSEIKDYAKGVESTGQLYLIFEPTKIDKNDDDHPKCIYIVDEASMISDKEENVITQAKFGSGRLLNELLQYDERPGCKFIFVGDPCQLPPIDSTNSPALSPEYFKKTFGIEAREAQLTEIMRQGDGNNLITVSKQVRSLWANAPANASVYGNGRVWGKLPFDNSSNISIHPNADDMVSHYIANIKKKGYEYSTCLCRSNRDCLTISQTVRQALGLKGNLDKKELLMVVQNNPCGLVNGDMVEVLDIAPNVSHMAEQRFRKVVVRELFSKQTFELMLMDSLLENERPNLTSEEQTKLFVDFAVRARDKGISQRKNPEMFQMEMASDPYLNALRCMYGYAITCHKAQGGEWSEVYVKVAGNLTLNPVQSTYQWIYTAMTRAKETLHMADAFFLHTQSDKYVRR